MPSEKLLAEQTKGFFGNLFKRKPAEIKKSTEKPSAENAVEELEKSLTKEDPLLESNTFNGDEDDERKNSKNKRREEEISAVQDEDNKENLNSTTKTEADPKLDEKIEVKDEEKKDENQESAPPTSSPSVFRRMGKYFKLPKRGKKPEATDKEERSAHDENVKESKLKKEAGATAEDQLPSDEAPTTSKSATDVEESSKQPLDPEISESIDNEDVAKMEELVAKMDDTTQDQEETIPKIEGATPIPARRRRRRRKGVETDDVASVKSSETSRVRISEAADGEDSTLLPPEEDVLSVTVHHSDHLRADLKHMSHPIVRVSLVDGYTGGYLLKSSKTRRVTSYYETDEITTVLPVMTQPFDFRKNQSVLPRWEETIIFNEPFESMVVTKNMMIDPPPPKQEGEQQADGEPEEGESAVRRAEPPSIDSGVTNPSPILFFVIRDFITMEKTNNRRKGKQDVADKGWRTVAWAFLKLVGADGKPNSGKKLRLQLFFPPRSLPPTLEAVEETELAFIWWRDLPRHKYPSTLYVTVRSIRPPSMTCISRRSMLPSQPEGDADAYELLRKSLVFGDQSAGEEEEEEEVKWSRLPGQVCKLPNVVSLRLWSAADGAFTVQFSNAGLRLAVACKHGTGYPVLLYGIPNGEEMGVLIGHQQLVYDIHWSNNDRKIVTSSGDGTAQVWSMSDKSKPTHTLPHPAYVYTGAFHPSAQHIVVTGGYDMVIRVWSIASEQEEILQELQGHKSFINSIAFDFSQLTMYSADSAGVVIAWNCHTYEKSSKSKTNWNLKARFADKDLADVIINRVQVHKSNKKLLLHCRDSVIRLFDVRINTSINFSGSVNRRQFLRSSLTPCGTFVLSGSEDGCVYVWNTESGDQVAIYNELGFPRAVRDVSFHPHEHMVAFCCFAPNMPVMVFKYDKEATLLGRGLISFASGPSLPETEPSVSELAMGLPPLTPGGRKLNKVMKQLDSVAPQGDDEEQTSWWLVKKKMLPSVRAVGAFAGSKNTKMPSPILPMEQELVGPTNYLSPRRSSSKGSQEPPSSWSSSHREITQLPPSYFSPHASQDMQVMAQRYTSQLMKQQGNAGESDLWKPSFTAVGGSPYRSEGASPEVTLKVNKHGAKTLKVQASPELKSRKDHEYVIVLYDYQANRSDELTMVRGDVIKVLYKDGPNWWFGERRADRKQGYFPTNYIVLQGEEAEISKEELPGSTTQLPSSVPSTEVAPKPREMHPPPPTTSLKMEDGRVVFQTLTDSELENEKKMEERSEEPAITQPPEDVVPPPTIAVEEHEPPTPVPKVAPRRKLPTLPKQSIEETAKTVSDPVQTDDAPKPAKRAGASISRQERRKKMAATHVVGSPSWGGPASVPSDVELGVSRTRYGVLKAVQAKMAEEDPSFSDSVVRGPGSAFIPASYDVTTRDPILTSTLSRSRRNRHERASKKARLLLGTDTSVGRDNDAIPMVSFKQDTSPLIGVQNPAYDDQSEV